MSTARFHKVNKLSISDSGKTSISQMFGPSLSMSAYKLLNNQTSCPWTSTTS